MRYAASRVLRGVYSVHALRSTRLIWTKLWVE